MSFAFFDRTSIFTRASAALFNRTGCLPPIWPSHFQNRWLIRRHPADGNIRWSTPARTLRTPFKNKRVGAESASRRRSDITTRGEEAVNRMSHIDEATSWIVDSCCIAKGSPEFERTREAYDC
jgi:hypothetical protein